MNTHQEYAVFYQRYDPEPFFKKKTSAMGWLRLVGSLKLSSAEYSLICRVLLQKRPKILRSLLIVATPYVKIYMEQFLAVWQYNIKFCVKKKISLAVVNIWSCFADFVGALLQICQNFMGYM